MISVANSRKHLVRFDIANEGQLVLHAGVIDQFLHDALLVTLAWNTRRTGNRNNSRLVPPLEK